MEKHNRYLSVLYLLLALLHVQMQAAAPLCPFAFSREEEFLSLAEKAEDLGKKIGTVDFQNADVEIVRIYLHPKVYVVHQLQKESCYWVLTLIPYFAYCN